MLNMRPIGFASIGHRRGLAILLHQRDCIPRWEGYPRDLAAVLMHLPGADALGFEFCLLQHKHMPLHPVPAALSSTYISGTSGGAAYEVGVICINAMLMLNRLIPYFHLPLVCRK
ncbi:hypothetical protein PspLS_05197 [Pyricularia sp. CBS 133598]|nr:hypothetical protein PspLS_05197 [Pyricularia sp. CBS 133598]